MARGCLAVASQGDAVAPRWQNLCQLGHFAVRHRHLRLERRGARAPDRVAEALPLQVLQARCVPRCMPRYVLRYVLSAASRRWHCCRLWVGPASATRAPASTPRPAAPRLKNMCSAGRRPDHRAGSVGKKRRDPDAPDTARAPKRGLNSREYARSSGPQFRHDVGLWRSCLMVMPDVPVTSRLSLGWCHCGSALRPGRPGACDPTVW